MTDPILELKDVAFRYAPDAPLLEGVNLAVQPGEILTVLGPNASGKSTLLQIGCGLAPPDRGQVLFRREDIGAMNELKRAHLRQRFGFVFQGSALLGELTVFDNLALRFRYTGGVAKGEIDRKVTEALQRVEALDTVHRMPHQLTVGMQKRVAIARALVGGPEIVFYDDPSSNLDSVQMFEILGLMKDLQQQGQTAVVVTSDPQLIMRLADRVALLYNGTIRAIGPPMEVINSDDPFIQELITRRLDVGTKLK